MATVSVELHSLRAASFCVTQSDQEISRANRRPLPWLRQRLLNAGGAVPFSTYMEWVLHDPVHGAYGSGRLQIGRRGDFVTAPSLGDDFAALLISQIAAWLEAAGPGPLALVETGPGEGQLALQLAEALARSWPELASRTELVLIEPNPGMQRRQRDHLRHSPLVTRWSCFEELAESPLHGLVLAHEVLDALAVERIQKHAQRWHRQMVAYQNGELALIPGEPWQHYCNWDLSALGLPPEDGRRGEGWCSELHTGLEPWLQSCGSSLASGHLLVIDYALEAFRYYSPQRDSGTLMAYRQQHASTDPLLNPGQWDLTAHLCLDTLIQSAQAVGWQLEGQCRQGEALLALGLAQRLHDLSHGSGSQLGTLLQRREHLLRLVDPSAFGDFRWICFAKNPPPSKGKVEGPMFLRDPQTNQ